MTTYDMLKEEARLAKAIRLSEPKPPTPPRAPRTQERRRVVSRNREIVLAAKCAPCMDCGGSFHPVVMDFHHRDPATKSFTLSRANKHSEAKVRAEILKCDLLCANCHRMRHL